jgi:hypothetical protein
MGRHSGPTAQRPEIAVEFADPDRNDRLGDTISWEAVALSLQSSDSLPRYESYTGSDPIRRAVTMIGLERTNSNYYNDFLKYVDFQLRFRLVRLAITNTAETSASDVRVELEVPHSSGIQLVDSADEPDVPRASFYLPDVPAVRHLRPVRRNPGDVDITQSADRAHLEVECASLQPGRTVWSEKFYVALTQSGQASLKGRIYAADLAGPKDFALTIHATVVEREVSAVELVEKADAFLAEQ